MRGNKVSGHPSLRRVAGNPGVIVCVDTEGARAAYQGRLYTESQQLRIADLEQQIKTIVEALGINSQREDV